MLVVEFALMLRIVYGLETSINGITRRRHVLALVVITVVIVMRTVKAHEVQEPMRHSAGYVGITNVRNARHTREVTESLEDEMQQDPIQMQEVNAYVQAELAGIVTTDRE